MPSFASVGRGRVELRAVAAIDRHARAGVGEAARDREAEARAAAGDERDLPVEV